MVAWEFEWSLPECAWRCPAQGAGLQGTDRIAVDRSRIGRKFCDFRKSSPVTRCLGEAIIVRFIRSGVDAGINLHAAKSLLHKALTAPPLKENHDA